MSEPDDPDSRPNPLHLAAAFAAIYVIWGSSYVAIRIGVETLPPFLLGGTRFVIAGAILYAVLRLRGVAAPSAAQWRLAAVPGLLMLAVGNGLVSWAELTVPSNVAALLIAGVPLYMALLDWLRPGGARPSSTTLAGIALGAIGLALLVAPHGPASDDSAGHGTTLAGALAVLGSGLAWSVGTLYARYAARPAHHGVASALQMIVGGVALLAASAMSGESLAAATTALSVRSVLALAYLTLFGSVVAFSAYGWLLRVSTPSRVATAAYVNPLVAVVLGWALLGEALGPRALAGAAFILGATVMMTVGPRPTHI